MNAHQPAFSTAAVVNPNGDVHLGSVGLSKRELFAVLAMQRLLAAPDYFRLIGKARWWEDYQHTVARVAVEHADALFAALKTEDEK